MTSTVEQAFELYLHDIQDLPLLQLDDERRLFAQIREGRQAAERLHILTEVSADKHKELEAIVARAVQARETVIDAHLRLVVRIARQYTNRGVSLLDLIQEGNIGLIQAIDRFDPAHGVRFATYAVWWIRHAITRSVSELGHPVRLPDDVRAKVYHLYRIRNDLLQQLHREPQEQELAQAAALPVHEARELLRYLQPVLSLNMPLGDEPENELADLVPDPVAEQELSQAMQQALAEELTVLLQHLTVEERQVLILRFGLHGNPLRSRQDVGNLLGTTTERIHQLEGRALRKLRSPEFLERLREYIDQ